MPPLIRRVRLSRASSAIIGAANWFAALKLYRAQRVLSGEFLQGERNLAYGSFAIRHSCVEPSCCSGGGCVGSRYRCQERSRRPSQSSASTS